MDRVNAYAYGDTHEMSVPRCAGFPVEVGDLTYWDPTATPDPADPGAVGTAGALKSADSFPWSGTLAATQAAFALQFAGVSATRYDGTKITDDARVQMTGNKLGRSLVNTTGVFRFLCAPGSGFSAFALVGPDMVSGGGQLADQQVVAVATKSLAIGRVEKSAFNVSEVLVRIFSAAMAPLTNA